MKGSTVCSVAIFLSAVSISWAAVGIGRATVHDSHPNQCYDAKSASYFSPGQSWPMPGTCGQVTCEKMPSYPQLMISFETCGVAMVQPPCYVVEDNSKPYPDCCNNVVCPESSEDELFGISEENFIPTSSNNNINNETAPSSSSSSSYPSSAENSVAGTAMHFSLGRKETNNFVDQDLHNDLQSLEEPDQKLNEEDEESFEIITPRAPVPPPRFLFATFDDIDNHDREQRFNEVDAQEDYQLV